MEFGARRWFVLGSYSVQPSEFARLATVVAAAALASRRESRPRPLLFLSSLFALPTLLILIEPDLGSSLVLAAAWLAMMIAWPVPLRVLGGLGAGVLAFVPLAFALAVPAYQRERLAVFLDPDRDPLGSGFTLRQVEVALGGGGATGRGLETTGSALEGLATRSSDFALAQIGEQLGLLGTLAIVLAFAVITWRGLAIANAAADRFGQLLAVGSHNAVGGPGDAAHCRERAVVPGHRYPAAVRVPRRLRAGGSGRRRRPAAIDRQSAAAQPDGALDGRALGVDRLPRSISDIQRRGPVGAPSLMSR